MTEQTANRLFQTVLFSTAAQVTQLSRLTTPAEVTDPLE